MSQILVFEKADDEISQEFCKAITEMKKMEKHRRTYFFYPINVEHIEKYADVWRQLGYHTEIHKDYLDISAWSRGTHCRVSMSIPHGDKFSKDYFPELYHEQLMTQEEMLIFKQKNVSEDLEKIFEIIFSKILPTDSEPKSIDNNYISIQDKEFSLEITNMTDKERELCYVDGIVVVVKGNFFLLKMLISICQMLLVNQLTLSISMFKYLDKLQNLKIISYDFTANLVTMKICK